MKHIMTSDPMPIAFVTSGLNMIVNRVMVLLFD